MAISDLLCTASYSIHMDIDRKGPLSPYSNEERHWNNHSSYPDDGLEVSELEDRTGPTGSSKPQLPNLFKQEVN